MDRGAWRATAHGVAKSWTPLSTHTMAWNSSLCPIRNQLASRSWIRFFLLWFQKGEQRAICEHDRWVYFSIVVGRTFKTITVVQNSNEQWVTILLCLDNILWSETWWRTIALDSILAVQGALKSLLQHHSSKASILLRSSFFIVQLSHPYTTTGKTIDLTRWTFVGKVMSLLLNMLSRLVITFLPRSKHLLISWLQSPSAVILESRKIKSVSISIVSPSICHEWWDWMPWF